MFWQSHKKMKAIAVTNKADAVECVEASQIFKLLLSALGCSIFKQEFWSLLLLVMQTV